MKHLGIDRNGQPFLSDEGYNAKSTFQFNGVPTVEGRNNVMILNPGATARKLMGEAQNSMVIEERNRNISKRLRDETLSRQNFDDAQSRASFMRDKNLQRPSEQDVLMGKALVQQMGSSDFNQFQQIKMHPRTGVMVASESFGNLRPQTMGNASDFRQNDVIVSDQQPSSYIKGAPVSDYATQMLRRPFNEAVYMGSEWDKATYKQSSGKLGSWLSDVTQTNWSLDSTTAAADITAVAPQLLQAGIAALTPKPGPLPTTLIAKLPVSLQTANAQYMMLAILALAVGGGIYFYTKKR
jgi:hypothetical protein